MKIFNHLDIKSYISKSFMNQKERLKELKPIQLNVKGNKTYQILWDTTKEVLRDECIWKPTLKNKKSQTNHLSSLKILEKEG